MSSIVDRYTFLTERQRQEIVRKWARLDLRCSESRGQCDRFVGHAHGGPGNQVNLCYYSFVSSRSLCDLVGTIMHEQGHAHGFRMVPGHNQPTAYHHDHDPIYRMGDLAEGACEADATFTDAALSGTGGRAIGAACTSDQQCDSSRCAGGSCVCTEDSDCPGGQSCFKPVAGRNFCSSTSLALGAACTRDDQCRSNQCEGDVCVCRHDTDCPSGQVCRTPITGANRCEAESGNGELALGAACTRDAACRSNKCESGRCVCNSDGDCPAGQECYRPITAPNACRLVALALGASCQRDSQCRSEKCERDRCVCRTNDDCAAGQRCRTPITGANFCE
jgi:Cys-rich repeat protein